MKAHTGIGVATHMGWAAVVVVVCGRGGPQVVASQHLATCKTGDRLSGEPYHMAAGYSGFQRIPPPPDPAAVVRRGLEQQHRATAQSFSRLLNSLPVPGGARAAVLAGRGRLAPSLDRILASHAQIHLAEGLAVRQAVADALRGLGIEVEFVDARSLAEQAEAVLGLDADEAFARLKPLSPADGGPWRQEERRAALAAWMAAANRPQPARGRARDG